MTRAGGSPLLETREDGIAVLTLNRPQVFNAFDAAQRAHFRDRLAALAADAEVRALVLTGAGKAFSSGQDLGELEALDAASAPAWIRDVGAIYQAVQAFSKPFVVALNGIAAGAGFQVALHADLRFACPEARLAQTEVNVGIPSILGPWVMTRAMGLGPATEMSLTGRLVGSEEALALGLVHRVVPLEQLLPAAIEAARALAAKPPLALALSKRWMHALPGKTFVETVAAAEGFVAEAFASGEPQAEIARFKAERAARTARKGGKDGG
ncbi:enoyl-CoA hydratase/isomerase family protein [Futiania mangrovi]|uniref:Enoyl-CoA hydratase/isomerase family protein n=1 Tax=Futiania mangrovi TaxID=2959716 RepID=A0A9J6PL85_9PROT|nr:enoyl-CoA hydratase/isomerase family protein [Futiania mangrovii]MCP1337383.1 enoyl-CoA hydratase/isomerase family protein [Futiania mangrovii]